MAKNPSSNDMVKAYKCCTCGLRGEECLHPAECLHYKAKYGEGEARLQAHIAADIAAKHR